MSSITARSINLTPDYFESLGTIKPIQNSKTPQYAKYDVMLMHKHRVSIIYHNDCILLYSLNEGISETSPGYLIKNACSQKHSVKSVTKVPATFKKQIDSSVQHYYHGSALSTCSTLLHHTCEDCHFGIGRYYDKSNLTPHGTYIFKLIARKALFDMAKNNYAFTLRRGEDKAFDKVMLQFYVPKDNSRIVVI